MSELTLAHGLAFADLYDDTGLGRIDALFVEHLNAADDGLAAQMAAGRADPDSLDDKAESDLLIALAPHLEDFLAGLFAITAEAGALAARHHELAPLYRCKRLFVQRRAARQVKPAEALTLDGTVLREGLAAVLGPDFGEPDFAGAVMGWLDDEAAHTERLDLATRYAGWALFHPEGRARHGDGVLFQVPEKVDGSDLVPDAVRACDQDADVAAWRLADGHLRRREGFGLTDPGFDLTHALDETNYCIWCHNQGRDSCARGLRDRRSGAVLENAHGVRLNGCPLSEKISEFQWLKSEGVPIGALAMIAVDNPLAAATGHRICNDCMKSCIYQKQAPVDIPQAETRTLKDVLGLPWGFEIYGLLTRWNPLNLRRPLPRPASGRTVLVVGLGPAGFNLAHHLLNDGHRVVAVDGLKIEPLAADLSGVAADGSRVPFRPVRDLAELAEPLASRVMAGFGGVAEYGITVRWDKNFLKIIRLCLERRRPFAMFGGVRFGGTLTTEDAFALGFDHIALCAGAGRPTILDMPNGLARGVRAASDFLMALQLTGAARADSIANLQLRLPVVVIGGGLTAVDTATEAMAYYPVQVEKFLDRFETLTAERGEDAVRAAWSAEEAEIGEEFLAHGRAVRAERAAAAKEGRPARVRELVQGWGGATIAYRRGLHEAPSYTLNHEEVRLALEEGIAIADGLTPIAVDSDAQGHARGLTCTRQAPGGDPEAITLPARAILVAAGTRPNTVLAREEPGLYHLEGRFFQAVDGAGQPVAPERNAKPATVEVLLHRRDDGRAISYWGDLHPSFAGNVVKAMGGAKQGFPVVTRVMGEQPPVTAGAAGSPGPQASDLFARLNGDLRAVVHAVNRLAPTIVEVVVRAPAAARAFRPGQFFRLQNYESHARRDDGTVLAMEGLAMTGAWVDVAAGLVGVIVLEMGGSSDLCAHLQPGEPVVLMGPTGEPTTIAAKETVLLAGGGLGNAVLFSIGAAFRAAGSRVIYFAGYRNMADRYYVERIEAAADQVVWCSDHAPGFAPTRQGDLSFVGNIVDAMVAYGEGRLGQASIPLQAVDRIIAIGSDRMMAAVATARHGALKPHLKPGHRAIGSINSPMQCMMKEICAQCLQIHRDPATGQETVVFSCFNQDQPLDLVDFSCLHERLGQNSVQEKLTAQWIDRSLKRLNLREEGRP
ncbi:MAG: FAD-dependent oxidoreductase [Alphaproteobacteria bacterium]